MQTWEKGWLVVLKNTRSTISRWHGPRSAEALWAANCAAASCHRRIEKTCATRLRASKP